MVEQVSSKSVKAISRYVRMAPNKVRRVATQIVGKNYKDALLILEFMPYSACQPVMATLKSAAANAEHNLGLSKDELDTDNCFVDQGPIIKRVRPRAQGRAYSIHKHTSHITVYLK